MTRSCVAGGGALGLGGRKSSEVLEAAKVRATIHVHAPSSPLQSAKDGGLHGGRCRCGQGRAVGEEHASSRRRRLRGSSVGGQDSQQSCPQSA